MPQSAAVAALDDILASQYNNLRDDVLSTTLGHLHDGTAGRLHTSFTVRGTTTPQLEVGYDVSNYVRVSVSATGAITYDAAGSGAGHTFAEGVTITTGGVTVSAGGITVTRNDTGGHALSVTATNVAGNYIANFSSTTNGDGTNAIGVNVSHTVQNATNTNQYGQRIVSTKSGTGTTTNHYGLYVDVSGGTTVYGIYVNAGGLTINAGGATITGASRFVDGERIGVDSTNNLLDDASNGAGTATLYIGNASINVTSDRRLKTDITPTQRDALGLLNRLRVVDYAWNDPGDTAPVNRNSRGRWTGLVAQEVVGVVPWVVNAPDPTCPMCLAGQACSQHPSSWRIEHEQFAGLFVAAFQQVSERLRVLEQLHPAAE